MITKTISIAIAVAILWVVYRVLFGNSNRLHFNRAFLLFAMAFSLALPPLGTFIGNNTPQLADIRQSIFKGLTLDEIVIISDGATTDAITEAGAVHPATSSVWKIVGTIYIVGVAIMTLIFLLKLGKIALLVWRSPKRKMNGYTAVFTERQGSFSFFNHAFFPDENVAPEIVRHELSHIRHHHSFDIIFVELMMILQWFNPFIYLYKRELQSIHEYMADRDVVATGIDKKNYMMLILQQCTAVDFSNMSNNFSLILTKKRIKMITQNEKTKGFWMKLLVTMPLLAVLLIANTKVTANEKSAEKPNDEISSEMLAIQEKTGENTAYGIPAKENDSIHLAVEVAPEFPGGANGLVEYVRNNIQYPQKAVENGIEGKVFVQFVVEKDGSISNISVLRGVNEELDAEAVRVVKSLPKFTPGMHKGEPVRVQYTLPVNFKLNGNETH